MTEQLLKEILTELKEIREHLTGSKPESKTPIADKIPATIDDLRKIFAVVSSLGKKEELLNILKSYGVEKLPQLPPDKYDEVFDKASALEGVPF